MTILLAGVAVFALVLIDHVVDIFAEDEVRLERGVDDAHHAHIVRDVLQAQAALDHSPALVGERGGALLLIHCAVALGAQTAHHAVDAGDLGRLFGETGIISGVRASSTRIESTSSTMAKLSGRWRKPSASNSRLSRR